MKTRIKELRLEKQFSQEDLARKLGSSQAVLSKIEREFSTPDAQLIIQLSDIFQVSSDYLLCQTEHRATVDALLSSDFFNLKMYHNYMLLLQKLNPKQRMTLFHFLKSICDAS